MNREVSLLKYPYLWNLFWQNKYYSVEYEANLFRFVSKSFDDHQRTLLQYHDNLIRKRLFFEKHQIFSSIVEVEVNEVFLLEIIIRNFCMRNHRLSEGERKVRSITENCGKMSPFSVIIVRSLSVLSR